MQPHKFISIAPDSNFMYLPLVYFLPEDFISKYLTQENTELKDKADDRPRIKTRLEAARLKNENEQLRGLLERIPPELLRDLQERGKGHTRENER